MNNKHFDQKSLMFFMYYGLTEEEAHANHDTAILSCSRIAFRDFQRKLVYQYSGKELERIKQNGDKEYVKHFEDSKIDFRMEVSERIIKEKIKDFLKKELSSDDDFDTWHRDTCDMIKNEAEKYLIKDENEKLFKSFSYGLTQKWLNMTLKNMLVMGLWDMSTIKDYMHIPVDSYIIEAACEHEGECLSEMLGVYGLCGVRKPKANWSIIDEYKEYLDFQKQIREAVPASLTPIDWEGMAWIAMAKKNADR